MNCVEVNVPIIIIQGGTFYKQIIWQTGDPSTPVALIGYTAKMEVRKKLRDTTPIISLTSTLTTWTEDTTSGIYFNNPATDGVYIIYIRDDDTKLLCPEYKDITAVYDLFMTSPAGETVLRQYGNCFIKATATRN